MAEHHEQHSLTYKTYFLTWVWLLVLTALALGLGYTNINEKLKALLLVCTTLAKILVIAAMFMTLSSVSVITNALRLRQIRL